MQTYLKKPLLFISIPLIAGIIFGLLSMNAMDFYRTVPKPPLAPPSILFPIVWTILYLLMGISSWLILMSRSQFKQSALLLYFLQLAVNLIWPLLFFNLGKPFLAFLWLLLLIFLVLLMIKSFYQISPAAAVLQIPYLLWLFFAGYLNLYYVLAS